MGTHPIFESDFDCLTDMVKWTGQWRFWGVKPVPFELDGEMYYLGADVANYLRLFRAKLYHNFPKLTTQRARGEQSRQIHQQTCEPHHQHLAEDVIVLSYNDCEEIFVTGGERFQNPTYKTENVFKKEVVVKKEPKKKATTAAATAETQPAVQHMDAVPCSTPVTHVPKSKKRIKTFPMFSPPSEQQNIENSSQADDLVPIRPDMEIEGHKLRDSFTWNRNEKHLSINDFARLLCDDLELPNQPFVAAITNSITTQLAEHPREAIMEGSSDQRVNIKLNIHVSNISLVDQIEWDMSEKQNTPEQFAAQLCRDLGLGGEFVTAISYSIRGQLAWHQKTLAYMENPSSVIKQPLRANTDLEQWSPVLETLTNDEMEKKIRDQDRNTRRRRRQVAIY